MKRCNQWLGRTLGLACWLLASPLPARAQAPESYLEVGDTVAGFETVTIDGTPRRVEFPDGRSTVLLFFLSSCSTCHRMIPIWNDAYGLRGKDVDVLGVIMDREYPGFFSVMPVAFPVVRSPGKAVTERFKVSRVPLTLRIGPGGVVEEVGRGLLDSIRLGEMFRPHGD